MFLFWRRFKKNHYSPTRLVIISCPTRPRGIIVKAVLGSVWYPPELPVVCRLRVFWECLKTKFKQSSFILFTYVRVRKLSYLLVCSCSLNTTHMSVWVLRHFHVNSHYNTWWLAKQFISIHLKTYYGSVYSLFVFTFAMFNKAYVKGFLQSYLISNKKFNIQLSGQKMIII